MTSEERHPALDAYVLNRVRESKRTHGYPLVDGTTMAADMAADLAQLDRLAAERSQVSAQLAELTAQRHRNGSKNKRAMADAYRAGSDVPDALSLRELDDRIAALRQRGDAIALAEGDVRSDITLKARSNAVAWQAELETRNRTQRLAVEAVIDSLEAEWNALSTVEAALGWIARGGTGQPTPPVPVLKIDRNASLAYAVTAMREAVAEKPAPRPTVDEHGIPKTGWAALHSPGFAVGDLQTRPANDALRAKHAARPERTPV